MRVGEREAERDVVVDLLFVWVLDADIDDEDVTERV